MGFVVLLAIGGVIGWLASIALPDGDRASAGLYLLVAEVGTVAFAMLASRESLLTGISAEALLVGAFGSAALLGGLILTRWRLAN